MPGPTISCGRDGTGSPPSPGRPTRPQQPTARPATSMPLPRRERASSRADPPLTTIQQSVELLSSEAVRVLTDLIDDPATRPQHVIVPTRLVIRASSGRPSEPGGDTTIDRSARARPARTRRSRDRERHAIARRPIDARCCGSDTGPSSLHQLQVVSNERRPDVPVRTRRRSPLDGESTK